MRLYAGMSDQFIRDTVHNQIAGKLEDSFFRHYRFRPSPAEVNAWKNSLRAVSQVFQEAGLDDHGVILEYQLPLTSKRLDCLVCAKGATEDDNAVIIELKQWDYCHEAEGEDLVVTWVGKAEREMLHPSAQARQYQWYLEDTHTAFYEEPNPVRLSSCAYLHNYAPAKNDVILSQRFEALLREFPTFTADDVDALARYLLDRLSSGGGWPVLQRIEQSKYRPSKKLMEHVANVIKGKREYVLLDEQLVVYEKVLACAREGLGDRNTAVVIVRGGPGTGKSVIAINLMSDLLGRGHNAQYVTGSKAFTQTLRKIIGPRGGAQFKYFNSYTGAEPNAADILICDEAHRLRQFSFNRFTPKANRGLMEQIDELIHAGKVCVFFIDDKQVVRADEIGSTAYIRQAAERSGCRVWEYQLEAQFRCAGSDGFVNWVNNTLGVERTANVLWDANEEFDFRILDSPGALERAIRAKAALGLSARLSAGFCWPWSKPNPDGTLVNDVVIGEYQRPWNAQPDSAHLAPGIPKAPLWAHDPNGINQIGCVYTAQGFEFDYIGVIWGPDLTYDLDRQGWQADSSHSRDRGVKGSKEQICDLLKSTYRVLLSRGLKGCYVYFMDKSTERFVRSRIESMPTAVEPEEEDQEAPFRRLPIEEVQPFENCVPLYELDIAAGRFGTETTINEVAQDEEIQQPQDFEWVELPPAFHSQRGLFVARVVGNSMNRRIPNGSWCLFRLSPEGSRRGRVVVARLEDRLDPETGRYTVKVYDSEKETLEDGSFRHRRIVLRPDSLDRGHEPIVLTPEDEGRVRVVAELVAVLS